MPRNTSNGNYVGTIRGVWNSRRATSSEESTTTLGYTKGLPEPSRVKISLGQPGAATEPDTATTGQPFLFWDPADHVTPPATQYQASTAGVSLSLNMENIGSAALPASSTIVDESDTSFNLATIVMPTLPLAPGADGNVTFDIDIPAAQGQHVFQLRVQDGATTNTINNPIGFVITAITGASAPVLGFETILLSIGTGDITYRAAAYDSDDSLLYVTAPTDPGFTNKNDLSSNAFVRLSFPIIGDRVEQVRFFRVTSTGFTGMPESQTGLLRSVANYGWNDGDTLVVNDTGTAVVDASYTIPDNSTFSAKGPGVPGSPGRGPAIDGSIVTVDPIFTGVPADGSGAGTSVGGDLVIDYIAQVENGSISDYPNCEDWPRDLKVRMNQTIGTAQGDVTCRIYYKDGYGDRAGWSITVPAGDTNTQNVNGPWAELGVSVDAVEQVVFEGVSSAAVSFDLAWTDTVGLPGPCHRSSRFPDLFTFHEKVYANGRAQNHVIRTYPEVNDPRGLLFISNISQQGFNGTNFWEVQYDLEPRMTSDNRLPEWSLKYREDFDNGTLTAAGLLPPAVRIL